MSVAGVTPKAPQAAQFRLQGIAGLTDPKWLAVVLCYLAAVALMGMDPWYGVRYFSYDQGVFAGILAVLLVAGFCWESGLLGPAHGINLLLHFLLIAPLTLLIGRVAGVAPSPEAGTGILGYFKSLLKHSAEAVGFESIVPAWAMDVFRNPVLLLLVVLVAAAFTQRQPRRRVALTLMAFLIPVVQTLAHAPRPTAAFGLGVLALIAGIAVQFCRYEEIARDKHILKRLAGVADPSELRGSLRIAKRAVEDGFITEDIVLAVVQREYGAQAQAQGETLRRLAQLMSQRLVHEHGILEIYGDDRGVFLLPCRSLFELEGMFGEVALWMRRILLSVIAVLWLLSPIDVFPDSVPIIGAIDDAVIALIGAGQWIGALRDRRPRLPILHSTQK